MLQRTLKNLSRKVALVQKRFGLIKFKPQALTRDRTLQPGSDELLNF
jgi:hypothetical protein